MKKLSVLLILLVSTLFMVNGQTGLKPTDTEILFKVLVTNLKGVPSKGDRINFINPTTGKIYSGISGTDGKFDILIPKGEHVDVRMYFLGKDSTQNTIDVPNKPGLGVINYLFKYELPSTITLDNLYFDTNKASIKPESFETLNNLVEMLNYKPMVKIEIGGHTDNVGGEALNLKLSEDRAKSVKTYLEKQGIKGDRLKAVGYGQTAPIDTNDTPEGRKRNRRTEIQILSE